MPKKDWKSFERLVAAIHYSESQGAEVTWNDVIDGRQFDVTVRFHYGIHDYLTVIECKDYSGKVPREKVDALVTKYRDVSANKAVMVSSNGYQSGCIEVAKKHGIRLLTLNESVNVDVKDLVKEVSPALNVFDVRFVKDSGGEYELDDIGGRLSYLMRHVKIRTSGMESTPDEIIYRWQLTKPILFTDEENSVELPFGKPVTADIPYEDPITAISLRFKCSLTEMIIANRPVLDNHVVAGLAAEYELRDTDGNVEHSGRMVDLKLGYITKVEPGKFYVLPSIFNYYYCKSIRGGLITWILVESYQYGQLLQARLTQKEEYSVHYVEIEDAKTLARLRKLLFQFDAKKR